MSEARSRSPPSQPDSFTVTLDQELIELVKELPERLRVACGRKPSRATVFRYATRGPNGAPPLPTIKLFGKRFTSRAALSWWIEQINRRASSAPTPDRNVQIERAAARLRVVLNTRHRPRPATSADSVRSQLPLTKR